MALPPPPIIVDDKELRPSKETELDMMEDLRDRICRLEMQRLPVPSTPSYQDPDSDYCNLPYMGPSCRPVRRDARPPPVPPRRYYSFSNNQAGVQEMTYRGPKPSIPDFTSDDPRDFARLRISLENILPQYATEQFKSQILLDHLKFEEAL